MNPSQRSRQSMPSMSAVKPRSSLLIMGMSTAKNTPDRSRVRMDVQMGDNDTVKSEIYKAQKNNGTSRSILAPARQGVQA